MIRAPAQVVLAPALKLEWMQALLFSGPGLWSAAAVCPVPDALPGSARPAPEIPPGLRSGSIAETSHKRLFACIREAALRGAGTSGMPRAALCCRCSCKRDVRCCRRAAGSAPGWPPPRRLPALHGRPAPQRAAGRGEGRAAPGEHRAGCCCPSGMLRGWQRRRGLQWQHQGAPSPATAHAS